MPRRWSTKTSVSTRRSATNPAVARRNLGIGLSTEGVGKSTGGIDIVVEVRIERSADNFSHRDTFGLRQLVHACALILRQVDLGTSCGHTATLYSILVARLHQ